jgi:hypothetical protein
MLHFLQQHHIFNNINEVDTNNYDVVLNDMVEKNINIRYNIYNKCQKSDKNMQAINYNNKAITTLETMTTKNNHQLFGYDQTWVHELPLSIVIKGIMICIIII